MVLLNGYWMLILINKKQICQILFVKRNVILHKKTVRIELKANLITLHFD